MSSLSQLHTVPSEFVLWSLIVLISLLGVTVAVVTLWSNLRQRPPHETPSRREFDELKVKVSQIEASLPPMEHRILAAVERATSKIETRLEVQARADHEERVSLWGNFNGANKTVGERLARLEAKQKA